MKQEDSDSNSDLSCNSDEEFEQLPSIKEEKSKETVPGMPCQCCIARHIEYGSSVHFMILQLCMILAN